MHFKFEGLIEGQYGLNGITDRRDRVYPRRFEVKINEEKKKTKGTWANALTGISMRVNIIHIK